ncbi:MAG: hypothetical protein EOM21_18795 [Gammaproteobacteria bacterium]|nr:hypothetical protein [Gammaproteobacteria bacterium]
MSKLIHDLPFAEYLALDRLSSSGLKALARSPAHYRHAVMTPSKPSPAQALGTHVHGLILEPETYRFAVVPECDRRTTIGKGVYAAFVDASKNADVIVTQDQWDEAQAMRDAVMAHPYARALLAGGKPEVTALWSEQGVDCKARFDWLPDGYEILVDLKTAQSASPEEFARSAHKYFYDYQACFYGMASEACGLGKRSMVFIVVESEAPFAVALYMIDDEAMESARYKIDELIEKYDECKRTNSYPGYSQEIEILTLPRWSR